MPTTELKARREQPAAKRMWCRWWVAVGGLNACYFTAECSFHSSFQVLLLHMHLWRIVCIALLFIEIMAKAKNSKALTKVVTSRKATAVLTKLPSALEAVLQEADALAVTRGGWRIGEGLKHLIKADRKFEELIIAHGVPEAFQSGATRASGVVPLPVPSGDAEYHYFSLLKIIIYQQLSAKSAEPILNRFIAAFKVSDGSQLTPQLVSKAKFETTSVDGKRKILLNGVVSGLSEGKTRYIQDLTAHFLDPQRLQNVKLTDLSDDALRAKLLAVNGLGPWSVDMFMLFDLQRANVLPMGDLVVRKGVARFHGLPDKHFETKKNLAQVAQLCQAWAPYCSLATCYMWKVKDSVTSATESLSE